MDDSANRRDSRPDEKMRLDVWLWRTRLFKTRSAASDAVETSGVRLERAGQVRRIDKPSVTVSVGDRLSYVSQGGVTVVRVLALPVRRGPFPEASACYEAGESPPQTAELTAKLNPPFN